MNAIVSETANRGDIDVDPNAESFALRQCIVRIRFPLWTLSVVTVPFIVKKTKGEAIMFVLVQNHLGSDSILLGRGSLYGRYLCERCLHAETANRGGIDGCPKGPETLSYDGQTLTSPSDSVLCLTGIQHPLFSSDARRCPTVESKSVYTCLFASTAQIQVMT